MILFTYLLCCWGITAGITFSSLLAGFRKWMRRPASRFGWFGYELTTCPQCVGFWVGLGLYFLFPLEMHLEVDWLTPVAYAFISSGVCLVGWAAMQGWGWIAD